MLNATTLNLPDPSRVETAQLQAEIHRMAAMMSSAVRQTAVESIGAAMAVAASGAPTAPKDAQRVAGQLLDHALVMQTEIDRFLSIAQGRTAA